MLKIEKLQPKDNAFTLEDHAEHGVATLVFDEATFKGEYHLHEVGTATVAGVGVAAEVAAQQEALPSAITLTLTKKVVRSFAVESGVTTVDVPDLWITAATTVEGAKAVASVTDHQITLASTTAAKETYVFELTVLVATGVAADDDIANAETLKLEAGETSAQDVHINILSNLRVNPGAKPNLTHFSVRGAKLHF